MKAPAFREAGARQARRETPASRGRLLAPLLLLAAGTLAACSAAAGGTGPGQTTGTGTGRSTSSSSSTSTSTTTPHLQASVAAVRFGAGLATATWKEKHGSTENFYAGTIKPGRRMKVQILYPTLKAKPLSVVPLAPPAFRYGPFPVIVFAHGFDVDPNTYRALLVSWVAAGYVVVAPFFPDTSRAAIEAQHGADTESDEFNQPGDVAFVVSQIVRAGHGHAPPYAAYLVKLVDPSRLIIAGQSDGADTVAALLYDRAYAATLASMGVRPRAVALLSGAEFTRQEDVYSAASKDGPAALVVQSLTDGCNLPANSSQLYNLIASPKWFLALSDATHLGPYVGLGQAAPVVERVTVAFFDLATHWRHVKRFTLAREGNQRGVSTITRVASVPVYPPPPYEPDPCAPPPGAPTD